jgi:hypothetical protein
MSCNNGGSAPGARKRRNKNNNIMAKLFYIAFFLHIEAILAFSFSKCINWRQASPNVVRDTSSRASPQARTKTLRRSPLESLVLTLRYTSTSTTSLSCGSHLSRRDWIAAIATLPAVFGSTPSVASDSSLVSPVLCNDAVSSWKKGANRVVHILGTAHVSAESAETAGLLVRSVRPNAVFVELDLKRVQKVLPLTKSEQVGERAELPTTTSSTFNPIASIQQQAMQSSANVVGNALRGLYKKLESEGIDAGQEFAAAIKEGLAQGATIVLGDQDVDVTLRRLTRALTRTNWSKLMAADESVMNDLLPAEGRKIFTEDFNNFSPDQFRSTVELVKTRENVRKIMAVLQDVAPEIYMAVVGERDAYMADGLNRLEPFDTIVAVVGLAHVDGIERYLSSYGWVQSPKPAFCRR